MVDYNKKGIDKMHGLALVTGTNAVGKGTALGMLKNALLEANIPIEVYSLSKVLSDIGLTSLHGLHVMNMEERTELVRFAYELVAEEARDKVIFLDMHFAYEEGERPDLSYIRPKVSQVIAVRAQPEAIYGRMSKIEVGNHPNRVVMRKKGVEYIRECQKADQEATEVFVRGSDGSSRIPVVTVWNDLHHMSSFAYKVAREMPKVFENFVVGPNRMQEGSRPMSERR